MSSNIGGEVEFLTKVPGAIYDYLSRQWNNSVNWLYGQDADGWTEKDQHDFEVMRTNPVMAYLMDAELDKRATREYMANRGLTWSDIHDPRKVHATNAQAVFNSLNFVSSNITRLYR